MFSGEERMQVMLAAAGLLYWFNGRLLTLCRWIGITALAIMVCLIPVSYTHLTLPTIYSV